MKRIWIVTLLIMLSSWAIACEPGTGATTKRSTSIEQAPLNINVADVTALQQLHGIGAVKAQAIVDYRQAHGTFASVDELLEVKGIGKALLQRNRATIRVD